jgi:hypothetical protein
MRIDLRFVDDVGCGDKSIDVVVCTKSDACRVDGASSGQFDELGINLDEEINLIVVRNVGAKNTLFVKRIYFGSTKRSGQVLDSRNRLVVNFMIVVMMVILMMILVVVVMMVISLML